MDKDMRDNFDRLRQWTESLAIKAKSILPQMEDALSGQSKLPPGCPSKEALAALEFRGIEEKLTEAIAAAVDIGKVLSPDTANRHIIQHTCKSGNTLRGQVTFSWARPPTDRDEAEALPWGKPFGSGPTAGS